MARFYYGGQAVMEGVMMRGRKSVAVAVRRPDGTISLYEEALNPRLYQSKLFRLPFLRGMLLLWEMLILGTRMMTFSANVASGAVNPSHGDDVEEQEENPPPIGGIALVLMLLASLGFAVAIFFVGPFLLASLLPSQLGAGWLNLILEGVIRLALLIGYLYAIGRIPDIERVFGYHGAEHKTINAMEQGETLDVAHVRRASRVHTRCGTGFLLLVAVVSIFVFALIGTPPLLIRILSRIVLVPVVAGLAYELMRLGASNHRFRIVRWLMAPGLALQGLTTREPDTGMIECAIAALEHVMVHDKLSEAPHLHFSRLQWTLVGMIRVLYRLWTRIAARLFPEDSQGERIAQVLHIPLPNKLNVSWITSHLAVGGRVHPEDIRALRRIGVTDVVDTRSEYCDDVQALNKEQIDLLYLPTPDNHALTVEQLLEGAKWVHERVEKGGRVLIHCEHGVGRSVLLTCAVLIYGGMHAYDALELVQEKRWQAAPNQRQVSRLKEFEQVLLALHSA